MLTVQWLGWLGSAEGASKKRTLCVNTMSQFRAEVSQWVGRWNWKQKTALRRSSSRPVIWEAFAGNALPFAVRSARPNGQTWTGIVRFRWGYITLAIRPANKRIVQRAHTYVTLSDWHKRQKKKKKFKECKCITVVLINSHNRGSKQRFPKNSLVCWWWSRFQWRPFG